MDDDREFLTYEQAVAMLPEGERIHTTLNTIPGIMIGADWDRADILEYLQKHKPEKAGPIATGACHGLVVIEGDSRLFIETRKL